MIKSWSDEDAEFWLPIVAPGGEWGVEQVKRELADYRMLLNEVPKVYCDITNGQISKPNTSASVVLAIHDDLFILRGNDDSE